MSLSSWSIELEQTGSPHYGERWARHWLDAARFGESYGFEQDTDREILAFPPPDRDFVIKALNQDMPWDQFVRWHRLQATSICAERSAEALMADRASSARG